MVDGSYVFNDDEVVGAPYTQAGGGEGCPPSDCPGVNTIDVAQQYRNPCAYQKGGSSTLRTNKGRHKRKTRRTKKNVRQN